MTCYMNGHISQRHLDALFFDQELLQELKHGNNKIDRENRIFYVT